MTLVISMSLLPVSVTGVLIFMAEKFGKILNVYLSLRCIIANKSSTILCSLYAVYYSRAILI